MPTTSQKNSPLTGIASDMGFGAGQLQQQLQDETEEERRRRLMGLSPLSAPQKGVMSPATTSLFQTMGIGGRGR